MEGVTRRAFSLVEALIVAAVLAVVGLPILGLISTGSREGALSEDFLFAEALASRLVEEWVAMPFSEVDRQIPSKTFSTADGELEVRGIEGNPLKRKLKSPEGFDANLEVTRVEPGLLAIEVTVTWQIPRERAHRRYALLRLRAKPDLALEGSWKL